MTSSSPGPTSSRIDSIDILRGFAVLGILLVNCAYFALPLREAGALAPAAERTLADLVAWGFVHAFAQLKFVTLFSFLFGIGFAMQLTRALGGIAPERTAPEGTAPEGAPSADRRFRARYARRLGVLALFGLLHGVFLFMGDILLCYAFCGAALLFARRLSPRAMLGVGLVLVLAMVPWVSLLSGLEALQELEPASAVELAARDVTPLEAFEAGLSGDAVALAPLELRVYAEGPFASSTALRAGEFVLFLFVCALYFGWRALGFFFLGAAAYRLGLFDPAGRVWRLRLRNVGLALGLPLTLAATALAVWSGEHASPLVSGAGAGLAELASFFLPAGYAGLVLLWSETARGALAHALAAVGRTALTNYIGQSVVMSWIVCHWGLGLYGQLELPGLLALSAAIFAAQLVASPLWLRRFRMGPLEWLWRWATYGARPAFRR